MIAVKLMGGLGNQMFQYATARRLALHLNTDLILNTSFLDSRQPGCTVRKYELNHLSIDTNTVSTQEIAFEQFRSSSAIDRWVAQIKCWFGMPQAPPHLASESTFAFNPEILSIDDNCYLDGYWQSEKYFLDIRGQLLQEFEPRTPLDGKNRLVAEQIIETEAVSVHVRRGDYIFDSKTADFHGHCSLDYYRRAFFTMKENVVNPHYYFFSDDIDWVKEHLKPGGRSTYIDHNIDCGYEDLRLMSMCNHHVIANSSFSWWGAWLGRNSNKIVIAPDRWFQNDDLDTRDLLPPSWKQIKI